MSGNLRFNITVRFLRVWYRNAIVYRRIWKINFLTPLLEPLFYLMAFGYGLGTLIATVPFADRELPYLVFIAPALLAVAVMYNAFFENTYASFVRMYYQKTFDAIMATPLSLDEVITGEIVWGATKSVIAAAIMLGVIYPFGLIRYPHGLLIIPLAFLGGLTFGSIGMLFTGIVANIETFNLPVFLFITPMFLFSSTFFPLTSLPGWAQVLAKGLPLTHLVRATRYLCLGMSNMETVWSVIFLLVLTGIFFPLGILAMRRRLIR